jgi:hypothetical protein
MDRGFSSGLRAGSGGIHEQLIQILHRALTLRLLTIGAETEFRGMMSPMFRRSPKTPSESGLADRIQKIASGPADDRAPSKTPAVDWRGDGSDRAPTFVHGTVELESGVRENVAVRDVSGDGVRIDFARTLTLPDRVHLSAPGMGLRSWAQVVWRKQRSAGLKLEPRE